MHYNYFRDYDPAVGRYVKSDPIGLGGGLNTYGYVEAGPLVFSDPKGLVKHISGQSIEGGKNCTIRIDQVLDEKTGKITRHIHWDCRGNAGAAGEGGGSSHGSTCDAMPKAVRQCAARHGFQCKPNPEPGKPFMSCDQDCQKAWRPVIDSMTGVVTIILICVTLATS